MTPTATMQSIMIDPKLDDKIIEREDIRPHSIVESIFKEEKATTDEEKICAIENARRNNSLRQTGSTLQPPSSENSEGFLSVIGHYLKCHSCF